MSYLRVWHSISIYIHTHTHRYIYTHTHTQQPGTKVRLTVRRTKPHGKGIGDGDFEFHDVSVVRARTDPVRCLPHPHPVQFQYGLSNCRNIVRVCPRAIVRACRLAAAALDSFTHHKIVRVCPLARALQAFGYVGDVLMCLCASLTHLCVYVFHSSSQSLCLCLSCYVTAHGKRCMKLSSQRQDRRKIRCLLHVYNLHAWVSCACVEPVVSFPCVEPVFSMCRTCV